MNDNMNLNNKNDKSKNIQNKQNKQKKFSQSKKYFIIKSNTIIIT